MVKTRYTKMDPNHMARVGPLGPNGEEILVSIVYDQVEVAAKYSQQDCKLDRLLDGIEEEVFESWATMYFPSSWIIKTIVIADLFASTSESEGAESFRIPSRLCKNRGMRGDQA